jgi:hypothetical protein
MKHEIFSGVAALTFCAAASADYFHPQTEAPPQPPPPMYQVTPAWAQGQVVYVYDQKPLQGAPELIPQSEAQSIVDQFRTNYSSHGSPRILIYVNRELLDESSGMKLTGRSKRVETTSVSNTGASASNTPAQTESVTTHTVAESTYNSDTKPAPTLADRQTVRDVERLMGRPLRGAGVSLVDQHLASQLLHGHPLTANAGETEQGQHDLKAVSSIADIVVEVLMTSRNVTVPEISGDRTYSVPDIQMTAIRLKDFKVIGQASAADVANRGGSPGFVARNFGVQAITEATTVALMEDMLREAQ